MQKLLVAVVLGMVILLCGAPKSFAHRPIFAQDNNDLFVAQEVGDPAISWAIYAQLIPGEVHFYRFDTAEELAFFSQIIIPARELYRDFSPWFALLCPDGDGSGGDEAARVLNLPFVPPAGYSVTVALDSGVQETFFEPFTQTRYWMRQEYRTDLAPGQYFLAVWCPQGTGGKYTLTVGEEEEWGLRDFLSFPLIWLRVRWWYSSWQTSVILLVLAAAVVLLFLRLRLLFHR